MGAIWYDCEGAEKSAEITYSFTAYFRCHECGSAGPWEISDKLKLLGRMLASRIRRNDNGLFVGRLGLFDGTFIQTPAMGEDYLRGLIEKEPRNAFLCTRLANLFRGSGERKRAIEWYGKAIALDAGDVEARYYLFAFAVEDCEVATALTHAPLLVRYLLRGKQTNNADLTEGIAWSVVGTLRDSPEEFRAEFLRKPPPTPEPPERKFIRSLLELEGSEDAITDDATDRLLHGEAEPPFSLLRIDAPSAVPEHSVPSVDPIPSLRDLVAAAELNVEKLSVPLEAGGQGHIRARDRQSVPLSDGTKVASWPAPSLRALFRGDRAPRANMEYYPPEYCTYFFFIEKHLLTVCESMGDRTDQEMEEIYSIIRRRPDGRSLGPTHDFLRQVAALLLGMYSLSQSEFEAVFGQLERSVRHWALRPVSRNYVEYLRSSLP